MSFITFDTFFLEPVDGEREFTLFLRKYKNFIYLRSTSRSNDCTMTDSIGIYNMGKFELALRQHLIADLGGKFYQKLLYTVDNLFKF